MSVQTVTIDSLAHRGDGVAKGAAGPIFVPLTLPGETVVVETTGDRAEPVEVVAASPDRIDPICPHFGVCGGCALQHIAAPVYLEWKREQVAAALNARGLEADVAPVVACRPATRRRAIFTASRVAGRVVLGYHRRLSNQLVAIETCAVVTPRIEAALPVLRRIAELLTPRRGELRLTVLDSRSGLDVTLANAEKKSGKLFPKLGQIAAEAGLARLTVDGETVIEIRPPELDLGAAVVPPPGGFVQAVAEAETAMVERVLAALKGAKSVADLFAGSGTFTLRMARKATVHAVEGDSAALGAIDAARRRTQGLKAISLENRDLFRRPLAVAELERFDGVVFDPPRAGAKEQAAALAASPVKTVVAVSCNPATLARDLRILVDGGYELKSVQPVDQFLFSSHIEVVAVLQRRARHGADATVWKF